MGLRSALVCLAAASPVAIACPASSAAALPDLRIEKGDAGFRINSSAVPETAPLLRLLAVADSLSKAGRLENVEVVGSASPDGPARLNGDLALRRAENIAALFTRSGISLSLVKVSSIGEDAEGFRCLVAQSSSPYAAKVLEAFGDGSDEVDAALRSMDNGNVWRWLELSVFPRLRTATVTVKGDDGTVVKAEIEAPAKEEVIRPCIEEPLEEIETEEVVDESVTVPEKEWRRGFYLKTNLPAWLMLWTNAAAEIDIAPHWSATLPVYYSGFNYFKHTLKFRVFAIQPEVRYWFRRVDYGNSGPFVGAHFGLGWYNAAFKGDHRYQDHDRRTPAVGGGIAVGWRFNLSGDGRWQMEATVGAGVYRLDYDIFENRYNGLVVGRRKRTFYGIDQAALSLSYRFDVGGKKAKEGGER